jgi:hypothetical protein
VTEVSLEFDVLLIEYNFVVDSGANMFSVMDRVIT